MYFVTCELEDITHNQDGTVSCIEWEVREVSFPMYELDQAELHELMALTAAFLAAMFCGKMLLRWLLNIGSSSASD